jgi:hypothetical protein
VTLPNDVARCPGRALLVNLRPTTDPRCDGCLRLTTGRAEVAQWVADGRPRVDGGKPLMRCVWMAAPYPPVWPCGMRIDQHAEPDPV